MQSFVVCLLLLPAVFAAEDERLMDKDLRLKVIRPDGQRFLTLRCSMIPYRTYLASVTKVHLFAADDLDGETGEFKLLAAIARGWDKPKLSQKVAEAEATVTGEVLEDAGEMTYLEFSWKQDTGGYCKSYECVVTGEDKDGNPTTIFTVNRVKSMENKACRSESSGSSGCVCQ